MLRFDNLTSRRQWIGASLLAGVGCRRTADKFLGTVSFEGESRSPLETLIGDELDGRRFLDLSDLDRAHLVTPTERFYVRTRASHLLDTSRPWSCQVAEARIGMEELKAQSSPQGLHLMECAGNTRAVSFGMIGVASWEGVPLAGLLDRLRFPISGRILVSGFDKYSARPQTPSVPGASWIFSRQEIEEARAFLAVGMNGQPLTPDHGAPLRLVMPGWYGCSSIKWVNQILQVRETAAATSQMREYAARTHQQGLPALARDYQSATIDPAAMPVRIEKWRAGGKIEYRVIGIVWGGTKPAAHLQVRFNPDEPYVPVAHVEPAENGAWGLWTHLWTPSRPGTYRIRLRVADNSIRTRRLDSGFYVRQAQIDQV